MKTGAAKPSKIDHILNLIDAVKSANEGVENLKYFWEDDRKRSRYLTEINLDLEDALSFLSELGKEDASTNTTS